MEACGDALIHQVNHEPIGGIVVMIKLAAESRAIVSQATEFSKADIKDMHGVVLENDEKITETINKPDRKFLRQHSRPIREKARPILSLLIN